MYIYFFHIYNIYKIYTLYAAYMQAIYIYSRIAYLISLYEFIRTFYCKYVLFLLIRSYILIHLAKKIDAMSSMTSFS